MVGREDFALHSFPAPNVPTPPVNDNRVAPSPYSYSIQNDTSRQGWFFTTSIAREHDDWEDAEQTAPDAFGLAMIDAWILYESTPMCLPGSTSTTDRPIRAAWIAAAAFPRRAAVDANVDIISQGRSGQEA